METVRDGFAWRYVRYDKAGEFTDAEHEAREKRRGLWADPNPILLWEYRQRRSDRDCSTEHVAANRCKPSVVKFPVSLGRFQAIGSVYVRGLTPRCRLARHLTGASLLRRFCTPQEWSKNDLPA
jgi:hypothetical protein